MAARPKQSAIRNLLLYPLSYGSKFQLTESNLQHISTRCTTLTHFRPILFDTGIDIVLTQT